MYIGPPIISFPSLENQEYKLPEYKSIKKPFEKYKPKGLFWRFYGIYFNDIYLARKLI